MGRVPVSRSHAGENAPIEKSLFHHALALTHARASISRTCHFLTRSSYCSTDGTIFIEPCQELACMKGRGERRRLRALLRCCLLHPDDANHFLGRAPACIQFDAHELQGLCTPARSSAASKERRSTRRSRRAPPASKGAEGEARGWLVNKTRTRGRAEGVCWFSLRPNTLHIYSG